MAELLDYPDGVNPYSGERETQPCIVISTGEDGTVTAVAFDVSGASRVVSFVPESVREEREAKAKADADAAAAAAAAEEKDREDFEAFKRERDAQNAATSSQQQQVNTNDNNTAPDQIDGGVSTVKPGPDAAPGGNPAATTLGGNQ